MLISLCGDNKKYFIDEVKKIYKNRVISLDMFYMKFYTVIECERKKYQLLDRCKSLKEAREKFIKYVEKIYEKILDVIENNKDKIIIMHTHLDLPEIMVDIDKIVYFNMSDLKILIEPFKEEDKLRYKYDEFDYVFKDKEMDVKKLVMKYDN